MKNVIKPLITGMMLVFSLGAFAVTTTTGAPATGTNAPATTTTAPGDMAPNQMNSDNPSTSGNTAPEATGSESNTNGTAPDAGTSSGTSTGE